jgi:pimeloyl-ACP methyl ester carboxylesterase
MAVLGATQRRLPCIAVPTILVHGNGDRAIPVRLAAQATEEIPGAELRILDCGHFLPINCPDDLADVLRPFLMSQDHRAGNG